MTDYSSDFLTKRFRAWQFNFNVQWPELLTREKHWPAGNEYMAYERKVEGTAIVTGSEHGAELARLVPFLDADLGVLEGEAAAGQVSAAWMGLVDQIGVFAAMGAPGIEPLLTRAAQCLPSIHTSRDDDLVYYHWNRGLASLVFGLPFYRPISGYDIGDTLHFVPGATFELNVQGFLGHLAGAVEQGADIEDCEPAWYELLARFPILESVKLLASSSLVWSAIVMHHRIAKQPLATSANYLQASVARVIAAQGGL